MARYTLRAFCKGKEIERFDHRKPDKMWNILSHSRFDPAKHNDPFETEIFADRFEVWDSHRTKLFEGRIEDTICYVKTLK
jgi:hypothetical protein